MEGRIIGCKSRLAKLSFSLSFLPRTKLMRSADSSEYSAIFQPQWLQVKLGVFSNRPLRPPPFGQRCDGFWSGKMSRFGASHGCDWEPRLSPKRLSGKFGTNVHNRFGRVHWHVEYLQPYKDSSTINGLMSSKVTAPSSLVSASAR